LGNRLLALKFAEIDDIIRSAPTSKQTNEFFKGIRAQTGKAIDTLNQGISEAMRKGNVTAEEILRGAKGRLDDIGRTLNGGIEAAYAGVPSGWRGKPTNVDSELFDTAQKIVRGRSPTDGNRMLAEAGDGSGGSTGAGNTGEKELFRNPDGTMEFSGAGGGLKTVDDIISNPQSLYGKSKSDVIDILGDGWTEGTYGSAGNGWKFTKGDKSIFYHPGGGIHEGSYYGYSSGTTGKIKIVGPEYVPLLGDKATIIQGE
jgi:hypothetical protein